MLTSTIQVKILVKKNIVNFSNQNFRKIPEHDLILYYSIQSENCNAAVLENV